MDGKSAEERRAERLRMRSPVAVGDLVAGKYRIDKILAAGGMGIVAAATHEALGQTVALKFLLPDVKEEQAVARFLREARAAARIQSEHVARVFDCGTIQNDIPYMAMEFLAGRDLAQELKERGPLPAQEVVDLLLQALEGIAEAHAMGIIHRDLKPANLFLSMRPGRAGQVKVLDFGISKLEEGGVDAPEGDGLTHTSVMLGSPRYMSPEQAQSSKTVDARTDIWSLGVVLYELLDGKSPFAGTTIGETLGRVLLHEPDPIRQKRPDVPEGLAAVISRCLQRDRERRYRNVAELALALAPFGSGRSQVSVDRTTALLVEGQLASSKMQPPSSHGARAPARADEGVRTVELGTAEIDRGVSAVTGRPATGSGEVSAPEPTAASFGVTRVAEKPRTGRIVIIAAGLAVAAGAAIAYLKYVQSPAPVEPLKTSAAAGATSQEADGKPVTTAAGAASAAATAPLAPTASAALPAPSAGPTATAAEATAPRAGAPAKPVGGKPAGGAVKPRTPASGILDSSD